MNTPIFGSGGGGGCFPGETLICTPTGRQRLDELQAGDTVLSFDDSGNIHPAKVIKVHVHEHEHVVRYKLWGGSVLDATPNHWVLNQFNAFVEIDTLGSDDCLVDENGHLRPIIGKEPLSFATVYNLTVEGRHTFIAGGIRVHNAGLGLGAIAGSGGGGRSKGGGGGTRTPVTADDSLNSAQYVTVLDLISEGEIEGLADGFKSVFIDNTPLQNADNSYNFEDVTIFTRNGTAVQSWIPLGTSGIENEKPVGTELKQGTPLVRTITNDNVDAVRVTIAIPALQQINSTNGDTSGASVSIKIEVQYDGGGYVTAVEDTITGRTPDEYRKQYIVPLLTRGVVLNPVSDFNNPTMPINVNIKVTRITPDSGDQYLSNKTNWVSYTEITYAKPRYPYSALVALRVNAEQFSSIPVRSYLIKGIKVSVPASVPVDPDTGRLIYPSNYVWSGGFDGKWTTCPAWILYNLLTNERYGFGDHIKEAQLDKWSFFAASKYANELVDDGLGGKEARFSCNCSIQTAEDAYKLIGDLLSVMRCQGFWNAGSLTISQDRPTDPSYIFTEANVSEDGFSYSNSSAKTRPNVAIVSYLDTGVRDIGYEAVEDSESVRRYGVIKTEITAFACTTRGQAKRLGRWLLYTERYEKDIVSFKAGLDAGHKVRPGQVIKIMDPLRAGSRRAGRLASTLANDDAYWANWRNYNDEILLYGSGITELTVDGGTATDLSAATNSLISVILPNATVETRQVTQIQGSILTVATPYSLLPNPNAVWSLENTVIEPTTWRVVSVKEDENGVDYSIAAVRYDPAKYAYVEANVPLGSKDVVRLNPLPPQPTNLRGTETLIVRAGLTIRVLSFRWNPQAGLAKFRVKYRAGFDQFVTSDVQGFVYNVENPKAGTHSIQVFTVTATQQISLPAVASYTIGSYVADDYVVADYFAP